MSIYTASGFLASIAGVIFVSRVSTTRSDMGTGLELDVITAVVLGGTSIFGGRGTVVGTLLGLMLMQALKSGLLLAGVKGDGTIMAIGVDADRHRDRQQSVSHEYGRLAREAGRAVCRWSPAKRVGRERC